MHTDIAHRQRLSMACVQNPPWQWYVFAKIRHTEYTLSTAKVQAASSTASYQARWRASSSLLCGVQTKMLQTEVRLPE
jgi:hypothetical protein